MRLVAAVVVGIGFALQPLHAQEALPSFLFDVHPSDAVWALECFQAGQSVISEKGLRIQQTPIGRQHRGAIRLTTADNRIINIDPSADLACIIRQTSPK